jgi:hypothetical protein
MMISQLWELGQYAMQGVLLTIRTVSIVDAQFLRDAYLLGVDRSARPGAINF